LLNLNAAFFGTPLDTYTQSKAAVIEDPYTQIFNKQVQTLANSSENKQYVKNLVYHTDMDHPLSFHQQTLNNGVP
jgi:hypothetical protein